ANIHAAGQNYQAKNDKKDIPAFRWDPPDLPAWALPGGSGKPNGTSADRGDPAEPRRTNNHGSIPTDDGYACPECGGPMWDNREDEQSSLRGGKRPDWKCRDKKCDTAVWVGRDVQ